MQCNATVKECLQYPDHCIVAMYRALVIGVAFLTPDGYLLYIAVKRGFDDCHIGTTLLFLAKVCHYLECVSRAARVEQ